MKIRPKTSIVVIILFLVLIVPVSVFFVYRYISISLADKTWIADFGYEESEVHKLTFNGIGGKSIPEIPVKVGNDEYRLLFDTGCGNGITFTNAIEDKIDYVLLEKSEEFNRDGSHRGWSKRVKVNEIGVLGDTYKNIMTNIADWSMFSSKKYNGQIGLAYFKSKTITLDYAGHRIAVSSNPIDYTKLDSDKYVVLPLHKTTNRGQQDLPFFEAEYNNNPIMVYLDTGKNHSYLNNPDSKVKIGGKPDKLFDIPLKFGGMVLKLKDVAEANNFAKEDGLPYPTMLELNSDQIWKCNLLVTFDLVEQRIIFRRL